MTGPKSDTRGVPDKTKPMGASHWETMWAMKKADLLVGEFHGAPHYQTNWNVRWRQQLSMLLQDPNSAAFCSLCTPMTPPVGVMYVTYSRSG